MSSVELKITHWGHVKLDKKQVRALMRAAGNDVKNKTRRLISQKVGSGRRYGKSYKASAPGNPPIQHTGALRDSLKVYTYKSGEGFAVRELQFYSLFLTIGGRGGGRAPGGRKTPRRRHRRGMQQPAYVGQRVFLPRPHLDRVMAEQAPDIDARVRKALAEGLKWQETK